MTSKFSPKQKRFITEYPKDMNATQAAIRAGYSPKTAYSQGQRLLKKAEIKKAIEDLIRSIRRDNIADIEEVLEFYSLAVRGQVDEEVVVVEGRGDGFSKARVIRKQISAKDRIKAAEQLQKRYEAAGIDIEVEDLSDIEGDIYSG
ncbi:terminase small subunit [Peptococcus niger]|uniref:Phage terminase small subunit n=1 Tax=Peptococcus niger TaxID=2741 RepID=A0A1G6RPK7_PEPNI|nr:terminase small subunit [Peptococcus niger]SDD05915.1 phage terminase small subunit [Peptococcus niger]